MQDLPLPPLYCKTYPLATLHCLQVRPAPESSPTPKDEYLLLHPHLPLILSPLQSSFKVPFKCEYEGQTAPFILLSLLIPLVTVDPAYFSHTVLLPLVMGWCTSLDYFPYSSAHLRPPSPRWPLFILFLCVTVFIALTSIEMVSFPYLQVLLSSPHLAL